ncbi:hypothetical protein T492DRAFT_850445 [Pavlovales sp. CCMP2436]|nr:hypothetical protein T492DRAFT_850445 [Pavlovales sp. CCMP2436]
MRRRQVLVRARWEDLLALLLCLRAHVVAFRARLVGQKGACLGAGLVHWLAHVPWARRGVRAGLRPCDRDPGRDREDGERHDQRAEHHCFLDPGDGEEGGEEVGEKGGKEGGEEGD